MLLNMRLQHSLTTVPGQNKPMVPRGKGPDKPRPAELSDLLKALMGVPAIKSAVDRMKGQALDRMKRNWKGLSTGDKVLVISQSGAHRRWHAGGANGPQAVAEKGLGVHPRKADPHSRRRLPEHPALPRRQREKVHAELRHHRVRAINEKVAGNRCQISQSSIEANTTLNRTQGHGKVVKASKFVQVVGLGPVSSAFSVAAPPRIAVLISSPRLCEKMNTRYERLLKIIESSINAVAQKRGQA